VNEPEKVVQNIHKALSSKGRFVGEFGGIGNCKIVVDAIETVLEKNNFGVFNNPWYFPSIKEYTQVLESNGFDVEYIELIPRPTPIADIITWLELFANGIVKDLDGKQTEIFKNEVQQLVKNKLYDDTKGWFVDYVRLRFKAVKRD
jgi:2-isopropylmalate synthase